MENGKRTSRVSAAVTDEEKRQIHLVARLRNSDVSNQLREHSIRDLIAAARRVEDTERAA